MRASLIIAGLLGIAPSISAAQPGPPTVLTGADRILAAESLLRFRSDVAAGTARIDRCTLLLKIDSTAERSLDGTLQRLLVGSRPDHGRCPHLVSQPGRAVLRFLQVTDSTPPRDEASWARRRSRLSIVTMTWYFGAGYGDLEQYTVESGHMGGVGSAGWRVVGYALVGGSVGDNARPVPP